MGERTEVCSNACVFMDIHVNCGQSSRGSAILICMNEDLLYDTYVHTATVCCFVAYL